MLAYADLTPTGAAAQRLHDTSSRSLLRVEGLTGPTRIRGVTVDRPESDGVVEPSRQFKGERLIILEGQVWGATIDAAWTDWRLLAATFDSIIQTAGTLTFREGVAGPSLQCSVRLAGEVLPSIHDGFSFIDYQMMLRAADPRLYSQTEQQSATASAPTTFGGIPLPIPIPIPLSTGSSGGNVAVTNSGSVSTFPRIQVTGPVTGVTVENTTTGEALYLDSLVLAAGQTLIVTTTPTATVTVGGASVASTIRWADSKFPTMAPGANSIRFYGGGMTSATSLTVFWRDAYL